MPRYRLAVAASHPVQYHVPLWRYLSSSTDVEPHVLYATHDSVKGVWDPEFQHEIRWDIPLLDGYRWELLRNKPYPWLNWRFKYRCPAVETNLSEGRFDALLLQGKEYVYYRQAARAAHKLRIPVLLRAETPPSKRHPLLQTLAQHDRRRFYSSVRAFLCTGKKQYDYYRSFDIPEMTMFWSPYHVDSKMIFTRCLRARRDPDKLLSDFSLESGLPVILFAARFTPRKRPLDLLEAVRRLSMGTRFSCLMIGEGPLRAECERFVLRHRIPRVVFKGFLNQSMMPMAYAAASCLVLPSSHETWGVVVNEAMSCELPVLVSDGVGSAPDLVRPGENGYTYPAGDVDTLVKYLRIILNDAVRSKSMGLHSYKIVDEYSVERAAQGVREAMAYVTSA